MSNVVNVVTLEVKRSVRPPLFLQPTWEELTEEEAVAALAIPKEHREWNGTAVVEKTQAEKDEVDATRRAAANDRTEARLDEDQLRAVAMTNLDLVNELREVHGLPERTWTEYKRRFRINLDTLTGA